MTKITNFEKTSDPDFVPALNENLKDLQRRIDRQAEKSQRIEGLVTLAGLAILEVPHLLGIKPKLAVIEVFTDALVFWGKPHTDKSVFVQSSTSGVKFNVVLRG